METEIRGAAAATAERDEKEKKTTCRREQRLFTLYLPYIFATQSVVCVLTSYVAAIILF